MLNNIEVRKSKIESPFVLLAMSLFAIDFRLEGITIFLAMAIVFFLIERKVALDVSGSILVCFAISFFLFFFLSPYFDISIVKSVAAIMLAYLLGYSQENVEERTICSVVIWIAIFMALHGALNLLYNVSIFGTQAFSVSRSLDFWSKSVSGSTGQATKFTPFLSVFFYLLFIDRHFKSKLFAVLIAIAMTLYNIELGGRSYFVLFAIAIVISYIIQGKKSETLNSSLKSLLFIICIGIVLWMIYQSNMFGVKTTIESSYFFHRFFSVSGQKLGEDDRILKKIEYLKNFLNYPFGGSNIRTTLHVGYAHELWLDVFDLAGIFPYLLLLLYTVTSIIRCIKMLKTKHLQIGTYIIIGTFYFVINIQFFIEPVIYGSPKLVVAYCLIDGLVARMLRNTGVSRNI